MIIAYDPVAHDVTIDFEDGRPPLTFTAGKLLVKHYGEEGIFFAEVSAVDELEVGYILASGVECIIIQVSPVIGLSWQVTAVPG